MVLKLERLWGRDPGWFYTLTKQQQIDLMALWRHENTPAKERKARANTDKAALIRQKIKEYGERDQPKRST